MFLNWILCLSFISLVVPIAQATPDVREVLLESYLQSKAKEEGTQVTYFGYLGQTPTPDGLVHVVHAKEVFTGMLSPRSTSTKSILLLFDESHSYRGRLTSKRPPLWIGDGKIYLWGRNRPYPYGGQWWAGGNAIDLSRGFLNIRLLDEKKYGSSGGTEDAVPSAASREKERVPAIEELGKRDFSIVLAPEPSVHRTFGNTEVQLQPVTRATLLKAISYGQAKTVKSKHRVLRLHGVYQEGPCVPEMHTVCGHQYVLTSASIDTHPVALSQGLGLLGEVLAMDVTLDKSEGTELLFVVQNYPTEALKLNQGLKAKTKKIRIRIDDSSMTVIRP